MFRMKSSKKIDPTQKIKSQPTGTYVVLFLALGAMTFFGVCNPASMQSNLSGVAASVESEEESQLLDSIKAMVGLEVKYDSDAIGRITNLEVNKSALEKISSSIVDGAAVVNESSLTKMVKGATIVLPTKPVQPGDSWKQVFAFDTTALPASMALEFTYKGNTERDGKQLEVIDIKPRLTIQNDGKTVRGKVSIRKQQGQGTLLFDNYKGRIHELSFETVVETEAVIGQNTVAQTVSTKVTLGDSQPE